MEKDYFGTRRVAIVKDLYEKDQDRMHLDCVFSILSQDCVLMLEDMMGEESPTRRLVDEYTRGDDGAYTKSRENVGLSITILTSIIQLVHYMVYSMFIVIV